MLFFCKLSLIGGKYYPVDTVLIYALLISTREAAPSCDDEEACRRVSYDWNRNLNKVSMEFQSYPKSIKIDGFEPNKDMECHNISY